MRPPNMLFVRRNKTERLVAQENRSRTKKPAIIVAPEPATDLDALVKDAAHEVVSAPSGVSPEPAATAVHHAASDGADAEAAAPDPIAVRTAAPVEPISPAAADPAPVADIVEPAPLPDLAAEQEPVEQAVDAAATVQQGTIEMATTYEATAGTDKIQSMFGDANTRAKTAMEKSTKLMEEMTALAKGNVEALVETSKVAAKGAETMGQEAAEYSRKSFESATGAFKSFASVKSPTELFQLQSEYAKSSFDQAVAEASKFSEAYVKLMGDMFAPINGRIQVATDKIKAAAL